MSEKGWEQKYVKVVCLSPELLHVSDGSTGDYGDHVHTAKANPSGRLSEMGGEGEEEKMR